MTMKQFLSELKRTKEWTYEDKMLRRINQWIRPECPITAVANAKYHARYRTSEAQSAAERLGISPELAADIIDASDGYSNTDSGNKVLLTLLRAANITNNHLNP